MKLKNSKKGRGIDPRDVIDIVQRTLVLLGNAHYVYLADRRKSILAKILPDCMDLLSDSAGKKALLKANAELFGKKFRKLLTEESRDNKELFELLPNSYKKSKKGGKGSNQSTSSFSYPTGGSHGGRNQFFQSGPSTNQQSQLGGQYSRGANHSNRGLSRGRGQKQTRK